MKKFLILIGVFLVAFIAPAPGSSETFEETKALAEKGNAKAQFTLGLMYTLGQGVPQDYQKAVTWLRKAARQGNASAQSNLGLMYHTVSVKIDVAKN